MTTPIHDDIADALNISPEEAQERLQALVSECQEDVEEHGHHTIEGLGTFRAKNGDDLHFTPDEALADAVNHEYAHLSSVTVASTDETAQPAKAPVAEASASDDAPPEEEATPQAPASAAPDPTPDDSSSEESPEQKRSERKRSLPLVIAGFLLAGLLMGGIGWYVLGERGTVPEPQAVLTSADAPADGSPEGTADAGEEPDIGDSETDDPAIDSENEEPAPTATDQTADQWTIVVSSRMSPEAAEEELTIYRERFTEDIEPVEIVSSPANGETRHRVTMGRFESSEAADEVRDDLGDDLPDGAWILQLESDL